MPLASTWVFFVFCSFAALPIAWLATVLDDVELMLRMRPTALD